MFMKQIPLAGVWQMDVFALIDIPALAQKIPLVYDIENTGATVQHLIFRAFDGLPDIRPLPDPFEWSERSVRSTRFGDWACRRAEIKVG